MPFYQVLLDVLARDGRLHVGVPGVKAFAGTMTCPAQGPTARRPVATRPGPEALAVRPDGLYLKQKRIYAFKAGKTPGRLKRDGDDGYLVDPLYRVLMGHPQVALDIVVSRGLTIPSRLLLEIHYTAETAQRALHRLAGSRPPQVSFSLTCAP